jgi:ATP-dependent RNA helicase HelY
VQHRPRRKEAGKGRMGYENPRIEQGLKRVFSKIGVPEQGPFRPDPFQTEALERIANHDVLVCAPTGSGKTWIASQAIRHWLTKKMRVWYASPLKALTNSIYGEFCGDLGKQNCGILTGDRKENLEAPVIVGTTEILRNQLYDVMHQGGALRSDLVILDEAHYLSDPERGVVWEEVLIYLPSRVRLLLLSATISNAREICEWLRKIRGAPMTVVRSDQRPVPLNMLFLFPDGLLSPLSGKRGLLPKIKKFMGEGPRKGRRRWPGVRFGAVIEELRQFDLLPAIFFLKSRSDCDKALQTCPSVETSQQVKMRLKQGVQSFLERFPHLSEHRQLETLLKSRVASHHGGQLPYWKVLVEKMMGMGVLEAIFSTSTVAAGVNFPARTVVLVQSDRFNGHEFIDLTSTELHQMVGRAGRRGKDHIGFAVVLPGIHQDPKLIHELSDSPPEPLVSRIHINFSMTLNLLLSHTPLEVRDLLEKSFARFKEEERRGDRGGYPGDRDEGLWDSFRHHLRFLEKTGFVDGTGQLTSDGYWASKLRVDQPLLIAEAIRKQGLVGADPLLLAGGLAPFVWDRSQEVELRADQRIHLTDMESFFDMVRASIDGLKRLKIRWGFSTPPISFWPAAAVHLWAGGLSWEELLSVVPVSEGDMASLVMRTADHLRQVSSLRDTHGDLATLAEEAVGLILREPVYVL